MKYKTFVMENVLDSIIDYRGKTPKKSENGIKTLSAKSVRDGYIDYSQCYYISKEEYDRFMVRGFPKVGDVLMTTEAPLGLLARLDRDDIALAQRLITLRGKENVLDTGYLYYYLRSPVGQGKIKERQTGTTVTGIKQAEFRKIEIALPSIDIQRKVASLLGGLDEKILVNKKINDNLSKQLRLFFQHCFIDDVHSNWPVEKLGNFLSLERGLSYKGKFLSDSAGVPMVNLGNILPNSIFRPEKLKYYTGDFKAKAIVKPGDIIVANTDLTQAREVLGSAILIPDLGCSTIICSHHISIVRNCQLPKHFIHGLLNSPKYRERVIGFATGTTVLALPNETILNCEFSMPPIELMSEYESMAESVYQKQEQIRKENQQLTTLRDVLLPKLMSGELDVSCLDI